MAFVHRGDAQLGFSSINTCAFVLEGETTLIELMILPVCDLGLSYLNETMIN